MAEPVFFVDPCFKSGPRRTTQYAVACSGTGETLDDGKDLSSVAPS